MFKLRVQNPHKPKAAVKERANVHYNATRPGVILNQESSHGLFGKIQGMAEQGAIENLGSAKHMIGDNVKNGIIHYRCVLSLREQDALRLGVDAPEQWRLLLKNNINLIAEGLKIESKNLEYVAAIHMEKGHPHIHITLWDTAQKVKEPYVHPKVTDGIRKKLTHNVYKSFLAEWYADKSLSRDKMIALQKELIIGIPDENNKPNGRLPNMRGFNEALYDGFVTEVDELAHSLPKTGRITYKTLTPENKEKLNRIIDKIVQSNEDFATEMNHYLFYSQKIAEIDGKGQASNRVKKAKDDMYNRLGNIVLNAIKDEMKAERLREQEERQAEREKHMAKAAVQNTLFSLFRALSYGTAVKRQALEHQRQELSLEAKKELARKMESTTHINWDNNR